MHLQKLYVERLARIRNQSINFDIPFKNEEYFNKLKISILVGENGTCKTSLLTFLANVFYYPHIRINAKKDFDSNFEMLYKYQGKDHTISKSLPADFTPSKVIVSSNSLYEKFPHSNNRVNKKPEYVYAGKNMVEEYAIIQTYRRHDEKFKLLLEKIGYKRSARLVVNFDLMLRRLGSKNLNIKRRKAMEEIRDTIFQNRLEKLDIGIFAIDIDILNENIIEAINMFGSFQNLMSLQFLKHEEWISLNDMSSGERAMFSRFCPLINSMCDHALVLIDEPETNLHPSWIQQYVDILRELFSEYESHIILATHSPLITADVPRECIVGFIEDPDNPMQVIQYKPKQNTLGGDPTNILQKVFKLDKVHGSFTHRTHERILELVEQGDILEAMELFNDLSATIDKFELYDQMVKKRPEEFK